MKKKTTYLLIGLASLGYGLYYFMTTVCHVEKNVSESLIVDWNKSSEVSADTAYEKNIPEGVKRRKFLQNKLWRDKAAQQLEKQDGAIINRVVLDDVEYIQQLGLKLIEESNEVYLAETKEELTSEIGDVLEVIDCIIKIHGLSKDDIYAQQKQKRHDRGSFYSKEFVFSAEYLPGSFGEWYSLKDSKYVEISD